MRLFPKCKLLEGRAGLKKTSFCCSLKDKLSLIICSVPLRSRKVVLRRESETAEAPDWPQTVEVPASFAVWSIG